MPLGVPPARYRPPAQVNVHIFTPSHTLYSEDAEPLSIHLEFGFSVQGWSREARQHGSGHTQRPEVLICAPEGENTVRIKEAVNTSRAQRCHCSPKMSLRPPGWLGDHSRMREGCPAGRNVGCLGRSWASNLGPSCSHTRTAGSHQ